MYSSTDANANGAAVRSGLFVPTVPDRVVAPVRILLPSPDPATVPVAAPLFELVLDDSSIQDSVNKTGVRGEVVVRGI